MNTTATHLRTIALHWTDLREAVGAPAQLGAFGLGLRGYLQALDDAEQAEHNAHQAALRAMERDPMQLGDRPVPVRLHILDTMRAVEAALTACADDIAHQVQRPPMSLPSARRATYSSQRGADIAYQDRQRQYRLAQAELADPRRWRHTGRRDAVRAALWLLARVEFRPGPCRRLDEQQAHRIGIVAAGAAERVERALDIAAQQRTLAQRHVCGGEIEMHGGEGRPPVARCGGCGRIWTEAGAVAA